MQARLSGAGPGAVKVRQGLVTFSGASLSKISYRFLDMCAVSGGGGGVKKNILAWLGAIFNFGCGYFLVGGI